MGGLDLNKPVTNPRLVGLMEQTKFVLMENDSQKYNEHMTLVFDEIANRALFLAIIQMDEDKIERKGNGEAVLKEGAVLQFQMLQSNDETMYFPVFTDWEQVRNSPFGENPKLSTLVMPFDQIADFVIDSNAGGIVINPFGHNLAMSKAHVEHIMNIKKERKTSVTERVITEDTKVKIGDLPYYPKAMLDSITNYAKKEKSINSIYVRHMIEGNNQCILFVVDIEGDEKNVFPKIGELAGTHRPDGMGVAIVRADSDFGKQVATNEPFYVKKKGFWGF